MTFKLIDHEELRSLARAIFVAGGSGEDEARIVSDHLVEANLRGHDSHGVGMIPRCQRPARRACSSQPSSADRQRGRRHHAPRRDERIWARGGARGGGARDRNGAPGRSRDRRAAQRAPHCPCRHLWRAGLRGGARRDLFRQRVGRAADRCSLRRLRRAPAHQPDLHRRARGRRARALHSRLRHQPHRRGQGARRP